MKLSDKISLSIMNQCKGSNYDILIPNFFVGMYEMDVFKISASGIVSEYEIKISRSDFKADFNKTAKHDLLKAGRLTTNRFFFVTPKDLLTINDIPKYAGWLEYSDNYLHTKKNAPLLHKKKYTDFAKLARQLAFREANHRGKVRMYEYWQRERERKEREERQPAA